MLNSFKIINKKEIAPKIYEIIFESKEKINMLAGQFITFILPKI
jgi:NAD(P)H-flavin reductase